MNEHETIPFHIEVNRVIEVLSKQIYQSPLALLRENCQNAFDAILQRIHLGHTFEPRIEIKVVGLEITVADNGIGMTPADLKQHYWRAGSSGKNTPEARAAGVVGTFGIGAMANFGVAVDLTVETESAISGERTKSWVERARLSASEECIELVGEPSRASPGTSVTVHLSDSHPLRLSEVRDFLTETVALLPVPVLLNGTQLSGNAPEQLLPRPEGESRTTVGARIGPTFTGDILTVIGKNGEVWLRVECLRFRGAPISGAVFLRQGGYQLKTYRSWFGLSVTSLSSSYNFGGIANLEILQPTAGREALTTESLQLLQALLSELDSYVSEEWASQLGEGANQGFLEWVQRNKKFELCARLPVRLLPDDLQVPLEQIREKTTLVPHSIHSYDGSDMAVANGYATEEKPVVVISRGTPRRRCEQSYLQLFCKCEPITDAPKVVSKKSEREWSLEEAALVFRMSAILKADYFVEAFTVAYGVTIPTLPVFVSVANRRAEIVLDSSSSTISTMLQLYRTDPSSLTSVVKDFVRSVIFPRISDLVPSSTRQGADAFLQLIRRPRDVFEYDAEELGNLPDIWSDYLAGNISLSQAAERSVFVARQGIQVVDRATTRPVSSVIPDVISNERILMTSEGPADAQDGSPLPAITRLDKESDAKLLTIGDDEPAVNGYRCFVALVERAFRDNGQFFLQPHRTELVWSGQKLLYVFQHHSGRFGLYYELQSSEVIADTPGGMSFQTSTVVIKNQVYIPVPDQFKARFIPQGEGKKRFEVRCDLLFPDISEGSDSGPPSPADSSA